VLKTSHSEPPKARASSPAARRSRQRALARRDLAHDQTGAQAQQQTILCVDESGLTRRRIIQLVVLLEAHHMLEVRRGHGRGHVNFYRILREEDGLPVPHRSTKKVKSATPSAGEKVKFPTPPEPEKVKSEAPKSLESLSDAIDKVAENKEREEKADTPVSFSPVDLKRLGLTPGSHAWKLLLGIDDSHEPTQAT
jgi:hypothetical protein